ncbi:MAG TPA: hypothetical protein VGO09_03855 [Flavisolibacter sp.]|nr:hypothetical protein [Flavisolibacter sp.]
MLQPRGPEKNLKHYKPANLRTDTITLSDIYAWQKKYEADTRQITWNPRKTASKRRTNTPEDSLYVLKGYLWYVKKEGFDCDYHIEIGSADSTDTRIIVEVISSSYDLQAKIRKHLDSLHLLILGCTTKSPAAAHFRRGLPVMVTGFGFYDAFHKVNSNHGDNHTKKYIWELHPVTDIRFVDSL